MKELEFKKLSIMCGVLHNLFTKQPEPDWLEQFREEQVFEQWPLLSPESEEVAQSVVVALNSESEEVLLEDFNRLFVLAPKRAYPWGSVYTDNNHLLFGDTTRQWEAFLFNESIELSTQGNEPKDHIGLILGVLSYLLDQGDKKLEQIRALLSCHLLPWAYHFCQMVEKGADTDFYNGAGILLKGTLEYLQEEMHIEPKQISIFI